MTIEHILLSVTVVSTNKLIQYDDSVARIVERGLKDNYNGVVRVKAEVFYNHGQHQIHVDHCGCGQCKPPTP